MITKRLVLTFPEKIVTKPITYRLVKDFDLQFNILRAEITTDIEGKILIEVKGEKNSIEAGIKYLLNEGITIQDAAKDIIIDKEKCINCGICPSLCITKALIMDSKTHELVFEKNKCILCGFCENCCPVNAIRLNI
ncbi:MAG: 4Fe-4S binding protein [Actinobacteria bacterium]|nr:4Fe-4S binding protein [Actinomycetota bacterium]